MRRRFLLLAAVAVFAVPAVALPATAGAASRKQHNVNKRLSENIGRVKSRLDNLADSITRLNTSFAFEQAHVYHIDEEAA